MNEELGKLAFDQYKISVDGKAVSGDPIPDWDDLPERIRTAWNVAADAVAEEIRRKNRPSASFDRP